MIFISFINKPGINSYFQKYIIFSNMSYTWAEIAAYQPQSLEEIEHINDQISVWRFRCADLYVPWVIYSGKKPENCAVLPLLMEIGNTCVRLTTYAIQALERIKFQDKNKELYRNLPTKAQMLRELQRAAVCLDPEPMEWPSVVTCVASGMRDILWHCYTTDDCERAHKAIDELMQYLAK